MNRKQQHVNTEMDSGLGSDEDRRGSRTKEEKQLHNQQLLSGCFIDAASLSDEAEVADQQRRSDERRQGALLFQTSIPQFSMLQMGHQNDHHHHHHHLHQSATTSEGSGAACFPPDTSTPYNSIVHLDTASAAAAAEDEPNNRNKSPLGFYVDLSQVPDAPETPHASSAKKNIFSMVIDFEGPKKDKPVKLASASFTSSSYKRSKPKPNLLSKCNDGGSLSSSLSSVNSTSCLASTSRQSDEEASHRPIDSGANLTVLSASLVKNLSISSSTSKSSGDEESSGSDKNVVEKSEEEPLGESLVLLEDCEDEEQREDEPREPRETVKTVRLVTTSKEPSRGNSQELDQEEERKEKPEVEESKSKEPAQACPQFVKLSDLECQKPRGVDVNFTPRMSRSIPESHWTDNPFLMSRSACYRSAPHPIEPEPHVADYSNSSDTESAITNSSVSHPKKAVRRLGTDLLRMFLEEIGPDVVVEVDGHKLKAHKCILASRCQYFAALLSGNCLERSGNVISLQGFSYEAVYFSLCHIYSGAAHVPDSISLVELASLADMLGLEGLKEVVEHALKQRHCHNFHKPCAGCCTGVLEVLPLSAAYGLDDLYRRCLQWITQHFVRVWPSRAFASLPRELREKCYQQHVVHMTPEKVLETMSACDKVLATLPTMRWAEPVSQLVLQLSDACHLYHRQHFAAVLGSASFHALDAGLGFGVCEIEDQMLNAAKNLGVEQACRSYARCCKMLDSRWSRPFADLLNKIKIQLEQCLVNQADRLIRSNAWLRLDTALRTRIKELTPALEPQSRLPRVASSTRTKKGPTPTAASLSSSDSSRNSSPGVMNQGKTAATGGSPSLRRSLLLAAKAPQVPPSPSANRRSTLTQPTAASQARAAAGAALRQQQHPKSAPPYGSHRPPPRTASNASATTVSRPSSSGSVRTATVGGGGGGARPNSAGSQRTIGTTSSSSKRSSATVSRNASLGKKEGATLTKRPESRCGSPLKMADGSSRTGSPRKLDSRVTSPIKAHVRTPSPLKGQPVRKAKTNEGCKVAPVPPPSMTRSGTFLKEEPTVLGKVI